MNDFIMGWNNLYPYDKIYRMKYGIAFNSSEHRNLDPFDMIFDLEEELIISRELEKLKKEEEEKNNKEENTYIPGAGNFLKKKDLIDAEEEDLIQLINSNKD